MPAGLILAGVGMDVGVGIVVVVNADSPLALARWPKGWQLDRGQKHDQTGHGYQADSCNPQQLAAAFHRPEQHAQKEAAQEKEEGYADGAFHGPQRTKTLLHPVARARAARYVEAPGGRMVKSAQQAWCLRSRVPGNPGA